MLLFGRGFFFFSVSVDGLRVRNSRQYVIRDALCSENLFLNRNVHDPRRS